MHHDRASTGLFTSPLNDEGSFYWTIPVFMCLRIAKANVRLLLKKFLLVKWGESSFVKLNSQVSDRAVLVSKIALREDCRQEFYFFGESRDGPCSTNEPGGVATGGAGPIEPNG